MKVVHEDDRAGPQTGEHVAHHRARGRLRLVVAGEDRPEDLDETECRDRRVKRRVVLLVRCRKSVGAWPSSCETAYCVRASSSHASQRGSSVRCACDHDGCRSPRARLLVAHDARPVLQAVADDEKRRVSAGRAQDRDAGARLYSPGPSSNVSATAFERRHRSRSARRARRASATARLLLAAKRRRAAAVRLRTDARRERERHATSAERREHERSRRHVRTATSGRAARGRSRRTASSPCTARAPARRARPGTSPRARGARRR